MKGFPAWFDGLSELISMNRNASIDIAKAVAIGCVVVGHVLEAGFLRDGGGGIREGAYLGIYLFHMPFFFLLSGWLFKEPQPLIGFFSKKFQHLMLPYLAWLFVFNLKALAGFGANLVRGSLDPEKWQFYLELFGSQLYGGLEVHGSQMILWFPTCLFFTQQFANLLMLRLPGIGMQVAIVSVFYGLGYGLQYLSPAFHLPLAIDCVAGALPFFFLGHWLRKKPDLLPVQWAGPVFVAVFLGVAICRLPLGYHMRMGEYGVPIVSTVAATGGFLLLLGACRRLAVRVAVARCLKPIGDASMTIMYLHVAVMSQLSSRGFVDPWLQAALAVVLPLVIHLVFSRVTAMQRVFLGVGTSPRVAASQEG